MYDLFHVWKDCSVQTRNLQKPFSVTEAVILLMSCFHLSELTSYVFCLIESIFSYYSTSIGRNLNSFEAALNTHHHLLRLPLSLTKEKTAGLMGFGRRSWSPWRISHSSSTKVCRKGSRFPNRLPEFFLLVWHLLYISLSFFWTLPHKIYWMYFTHSFTAFSF